MPHALIVSYYFPPRFSIGGKRAHRFARYLPESGWTSTVLTAPAPPWERLDPTFSNDPAHCTVHRDYPCRDVPSRKLGSDGTIEAPTRAPVKRTLRQRLRAEFRAFPIIGSEWRDIPTMARKIARLARSSGAEILFATGGPWEVIVATVLAARAIRRPVIIDFRDPWTFGPVATMNPIWARTIDRAIERSVIRAASALTVTSEVARDAYAQANRSARVVCIRTGFDPDIAFEKTSNAQFTLVHFGNCYSERNLSSFLRALAMVAKRNQLSPKSFRLLNLGRVAEGDCKLARELGLEESFEHRPVLPYTEGLGLVAGADLALLLGFGDGPWFLPGKLYDYVHARTPILAIANSHELTTILADGRFGWAHAAMDIDGLAGRIEAAFNARAAQRRLIEPDPRAANALSARTASRRLAELFDEVRARGV